MGSIEEIVEQMRRNPSDVRFTDICRVCEHHFGEPRQKGSHVIFRMPWQGDPRINLQDDKGKAKAYQVRQALKAIDRLGEEHGTNK
jgi:hypothetical protein